MKRTIIMHFLLLIGIASYAQPEIRPDHPRIFFNSDTWGEIKERAFKENKQYLDKLLEAADHMPDDPECPVFKPLVIKDRNIPIPSIVEYGRQSACCALAWRFTGETKYLEKAKKMLKVSVQAYTDATRNSIPVSWYSHTRINALCAYDWIYENLTAEERKELIVPLVEHVEMVQPEYGLNIPRTNKGNEKSGFYGVPTLLWYSGLAAYGDGFCDSLATEHLRKGYEMNRKLMKFRNDNAGDDGGINSAVPSYVTGAYTYSQFNFIYTMLSSTGIDITPEYPALPLYANWLWWVWIRDSNSHEYLRHAGFGDSYHVVNKSNTEGLYEQLSQMLDLYGGMNPEWYGMTAAMRDFAGFRPIGNTFPILQFLVNTDHDYDKSYLDRINDSKLKARHFENLGQIYMRSGFTQDATYCTFTAGGSLIQHKHYDENNFTIYKYDHLALDSGDRALQTDFNLVYYYAQSVAHNVVLIHKPDEKLPDYWGIKQKNHKNISNYGGMTKVSGAEIKAFETNDRFTYIASDATACYGDKCKEAVRQFVFLYPDYIIVYDRVSASDSSYRKEWLLHTKEEPVMKKGVVRTDSGGGRLFCQTLLPEDAVTEIVGGEGREFMVGDVNYAFDSGYLEKWKEPLKNCGRGPYWGGWRIEVEPSSEHKDDRFLHVMTAASDKVSRPVKAVYVKDDKRDGVMLKIDGKEITFWFNRNGETGGAVESEDITAALTDKVQEQSGFIY